MRGAPTTPDATISRSSRVMVESRIKPYYQQVAERTARQRQQRVYRRNQVIGLVMVAAAIFIVWLVRTNPAWIFPPGWWRP
jgi:hypothetical protein